MSYTQKPLDELRAHNAERTKRWGPVVGLAEDMDVNDALQDYVRVGIENFDAERAIDVTAEMVVVGFNK